MGYSGSFTLGPVLIKEGSAKYYQATALLQISGCVLSGGVPRAHKGVSAIRPNYRSRSGRSPPFIMTLRIGL